MLTILCGKSACGKDTVLNELVNNFKYESLVSTTSRPIRENETNGKDYNFTTKEEFKDRIAKGEFVEYREYHTSVKGKPDTWYYGMPKATLDALDDKKNYITILDVQGAKDFVNYLGGENCKLCLVDVSDSIRKERAIGRGSFDETEWNRRCADDNEKFSEKAVSEVGCSYCVLKNEDTTILELAEKIDAFVGSIDLGMEY